MKLLLMFDFLSKMKLFINMLNIPKKMFLSIHRHTVISWGTNVCGFRWQPLPTNVHPH